jgi:ABC-type sulfate transport system permease component
MKDPDIPVPTFLAVVVVFVLLFVGWPLLMHLLERVSRLWRKIWR